MLKDEPSLVLCNATNDKQIDLALSSILTSKTKFKKYFKVSTTQIEKQNQTQVCIGCHVLSNRTLGNIKFCSSDGHLLAWLKKERIFIESDNLGIDRLVTIGHFTKIDSTLTHLAHFCDHLTNKLMLVDIDANMAVSLALHLKLAQLEAMTNGDDFVPILPDFEVYRTCLIHGRALLQVTTDVLGVKCAPRDAKLLGKFFTRLATISNDQRDGVFVPKGAVYLLGTQTYEQVLKENIFFLTTVATIPINLEYGAWFAVINPNQQSETEPLTLHDHLIQQPWFLRIELVASKKCLLVTTKPNLPEARAWIDTNLERLIHQSIPPDIELPPSHLLWRLDKPVYSAASQTYKKQFSLASTPTTPQMTTLDPHTKDKLRSSITTQTNLLVSPLPHPIPTFLFTPPCHLAIRLLPRLIILLSWRHSKTNFSPFVRL